MNTGGPGRLHCSFSLAAFEIWAFGEISSHFGQCQVDCGCEKGRSEGDADDLHEESIKTERVLVEHESTTVSDHFCHTAPEHDLGKGPGSPYEAHDDVYRHTDEEEGEKGGIGTDGGTVLVNAVGGQAIVWAGREGAVRVGAISNEVTQVWITRWHRHGEGFEVVFPEICRLEERRKEKRTIR